MNKQTFEAGTVVRAKGPKMTIENVCGVLPGKGMGVVCVWFEDDANLRREVFHPGDLERVDHLVRANSSEQTVALAQVVEERVRQDRQWGGPDHDDDHKRKDWLGFIREHADRATKALQGKDLDEYRKQLVEIAALAVAGIESSDRNRARCEQLGHEAHV